MMHSEGPASVRTHASWYVRWGKRALDLAVAVPLVLLASPLLFAVAVIVLCTFGVPVLFRQPRPGFLGEPFTLLKFRTMLNKHGSDGSLLPDGGRLTPTGRFLRRTSLDELPELFNVLKGDMSLVGPRPLLMRYYPYFTALERSRFSVRPGITGLAQVSGRNDLPWDSRLAVDVRYVQEMSLRIDVAILARTAWRVVTRHGLREDPGACMKDLDVERREKAAGAK